RALLASHAEVVRSVAAGYGDEAAKALARLEASPPDVYPKKLPSLPSFLDLSVLPPLVLNKGGALAEPAVKTLLTLLALSPLEEPLVALSEAKEALEPRSAARFAWDLFQQWLAAGANNKELWCFWALGHLGDDESARRVTPLVRVWPGEAAHARAVVGLDVLGAIGTDVALMHLHGIAQKLKFKGLQEKAREKIAQIAEARGLSTDELADRLVPDLDLDASGSRILDFGARSFRVSFDEGLRPVVIDASGAVLAELPKPNKSDDAAKAKEATETWKTLKADAKAIASGQVARLEQMMCSERRAPAEAFRLFFLEHPLLVHLVRRLLWGVYDDTGRLVSSFRVAEDRSLADAADAAFTLPEGARVGVVHRLHLSDALAATWGSVFADYQIIAPFEQLGRVVRTMTDAEEAGSRIARGDFDAKTGAVLGLESRGWRKGENEQGVILSMVKPLGALVVELPIRDGIYLGYSEGTGPTQRITHARLLEGRTEVPFSRLGVVARSELLRDLESLRA
ncbi:MAG: DUF4132 domain-containing protein, partial [Sandaracinaceae bacterium]|nr:DUF4132 domain-containing protein [Sandaracinaceae bacterium]